MPRRGCFLRRTSPQFNRPTPLRTVSVQSGQCFGTSFDKDANGVWRAVSLLMTNPERLFVGPKAGVRIPNPRLPSQRTIRTDYRSDMRDRKPVRMGLGRSDSIVRSPHQIRGLTAGKIDSQGLPRWRLTTDQLELALEFLEVGTRPAGLANEIRNFWLSWRQCVKTKPLAPPFVLQVVQSLAKGGL